MAIDPAIWQDILTRIRNLRGDMIGQWQGDLDNRGIEQSVIALGNVLRSWEQAKPQPPSPVTPP